MDTKDKVVAALEEEGLDPNDPTVIKTVGVMVRVLCAEHWTTLKEFADKVERELGKR